MTTLSIVPTIAEPQTLQKSVASLTDAVQQLTLHHVRTPEDYKQAAALLVAIRETQKEVDAAFDQQIADFNRGHKNAIATKKRYSLPLEENLAVVDREMFSWSAEQERLRRLQEEELAKIAKKEQDDQAIREAEELHRQGDTELADIVLETQASAPAPVVSVASNVPKVQGLAKRVDWKFRITNAALVPKEYLIPDLIKIGGVVRALKGSAKIPGIEIFPVDTAIHR